MANIRVKDLPNTSAPAADTDEFIIDSSSAGTRRLNYGELKTAISGDFQSGTTTYKVATLGSDNKLDPSQIPDTLSQGLNFVGVANSAGDLTSTTQGDFYVIQTAFGSYNVGDQAVYDGSAYIRVTDGTKEISEGGTGATTLDAAKVNLEIADIGSSANEVSLNGMLGDLAFQSSEAVSVDKLEVTDHIENFTVKSDGTSDSPAEITLQAEDGSINTDDRIGTLSIAGMDNSATPLTGAKIEAKADSTWSASTAPTRLEFSTTPSGSTSPSVRWTINSTGNLVASSGRGIDFGATNTTTGVTVSSSVLDHYEAGLWTPVVADATSGGNTATVGTAQGRYTRVGRIVQFSCLVANINTTGLTAGLGLYIQGLPFPGVAVSSWKPMAVLMDNITFSGQVVGIIAQNESAIRFKQFASGGADSDLTVSAVVNSTADIHVQGVYEVV